MRRLFIFAMLVSSLLLVTTGTASAQTTGFNAKINGHITRPSGGCPEGADLCGQAAIDEFGSAQYLFFVTSFEPTSQACGNYTATTTFTLGDGSTLTLDESGVVCGPDGSLLKGPLLTSYGNPRTFSASWEVQDATGQFAGMTGSGTDAGLTAGAALYATYRGTLES
jgi:hypothetical protein